MRGLISNALIVFQNCCPKYLNQTFLVPNLKIFVFPRKFAIRQIQGRLFQTWKIISNSSLKIPGQKYSIKHLIFYFPQNFPFWKVWGFFKHDNSFFSNVGLKYRNKTILVLNLRILTSFYEAYSWVQNNCGLGRKWWE